MSVAGLQAPVAASVRERVAGGVAVAHRLSSDPALIVAIDDVQRLDRPKALQVLRILRALRELGWIVDSESAVYVS